MYNLNNCQVNLIISNYWNNKNLAIPIETTEHEPYGVLTVNFEEKLPFEDWAYIDTNNNPWAEKFIRENNLGEPLDQYKQSGFCTYPLYKIFLNNIK